MFELSLTEKSARLVRRCEISEGAKHKEMVLGAHRASAEADAHRKKLELGQSEDYLMGIHLDKGAADKHHAVAKELGAAEGGISHRSIGDQHIGHANRLAQRLHQHNAQRMRHEEPAAAESLAFPEMRRLAGLNSRFPSLSEARASYGGEAKLKNLIFDGSK